MKKNIYIRIALKASRGDGDTVNVEIENDKIVEIHDRYITFKASDGSLYLFAMHNVLYYKIYEKEDSNMYKKEDFEKGINTVLV